MSCSHCDAVEQHGRYCVGCGKLMPPSVLQVRRVRLAPRSMEETQPVLRFRPTPRLPLPDQQVAVSGAHHC
jgi:hypothetical protein